MPWIEIDFAADIERANSAVLPRILKAASNNSAMMMIKAGRGRVIAPML